MDALKPTKNTKKRKPKESIFKCNQCSKRFPCASTLAAHAPLHAAAPFACAQCAYAGKTRKYLRRHVKVTHGERRFKCDECGKTFHYGCKLKDHMRVHTGEKPFKCDVCGKAFNSTYSLSTHKFIHTDSKPFQCAFCEYACRDSSTLRKHQARHMGTETYYQCKMCDISLKNKSKLKLHIAEKHFNIDVRTHICDTCGKRFKLKSNLVNHIQAVHERSRTAKCELCGITLSNRGNLRSHMRIHVEQKPYVCTVDLCERRFKHTSSLSKHVITHFPSKWFPCKICDKRFPLRRRLVKHLTTHQAKVKCVECDYCGVRFYNKNYLTRHIQRKHTRKRQKFICDMCDFVTTNKPSIVMHIKYGHAVNSSIQCKMCEKKFKRDFNLKLHYWTEHGIKYKITIKKKPKKPVVIVKTEPEEYIENNEFLQVIPKIEPLDDEGILLQEMAAATSENQLQDITEDVFDEFINPREKRPDDDKVPEKAFVDKPTEEQVKKQVKVLLEKTRQMIAATALERARRKYNRLMRNAAKKTRVKARKKIKCHNNNVRDTDSLLVEDYSISQETVEDKEKPIETNEVDNSNTAVEEYLDGTVERDVDIHDKQVDAKKTVELNNESQAERLGRNRKLKIKYHNNNVRDTDSLLVEDYSISQETVEDKEKPIKTNEVDNSNTAVEEYLDGTVQRDDTHDKHVEETMELNNESQAERLGRNRKLKIKYHNNNVRDTDSLLVEDYSISQETVEDKEKLIETNGVDNSNTALEEYLDDTVERDDTHDKRLEDVDETVELNNESQSERLGRNRKLKINTHQCYVCFKLFETKEKLLDHCKDHFDLCNIKTLKKCPLCDYATNLSVTKHLQRAHKIKIKIPYATFKDKANNEGSRYYYDVGDSVVNKVEIIPSIKNLNRQAYRKIDKRNRDAKNKGLMKTKLVKKGKEWIVVKEKLKINDYMLPKFDKIGNLNVKGDYVDRMKVLSRMAKKKGVKILFPCDKCDKICQTLSALKLHGRKHEANPKPFRPKVWKHKTKKSRNEPEVSDKCNTKTRPVTNVVTGYVKRDRRKRQEGITNEEYRIAPPKPVDTKHRCERELIEFYERNIKGGDIEFWQFLKIYNKLGRENVNDFSDLDETTEFGVHGKEPEKKKAEDKAKTKTKKTVRRDSFKRVVRLSKKEMMRRNEIKERLREKIRHNSA